MTTSDESRVALEQACAVVSDPKQHGHAMRFILQFRQSGSVIKDSVHVLQTSQMLEAVFEASVALRQACQNDWRLQVKANEKVELRQWLVQYLVKHSPSDHTGPFLAVLSTLQMAHACVLKRLWLETGAEQCQGAVHELCSHVTQSTQQSRACMRILAALITEFNPETAGSCGLTWTQHEQCRAAFEQACLQQVFEAGSMVAVAASPDSDAATVADAVILMNEVLMWPFTVVAAGGGSGVFGAKRSAQRQARTEANKSDFSCIQVSAEWHALMFAAPLQQWLVGALAAHASAAAWAATATPTTQGPSPHAPKHDKERGLLGEVLRHMLVQLCQVQRANKGDYKEVVEIGLHGFMAIITPAEKFVELAQRDDTIARGACNVVAAMFQNVPLHKAAAAGAAGAEKLCEAMRALAQITVDLIRLGGAAVESCTSWEGVCTGTLLDVWTRLLHQLNSDMCPYAAQTPRDVAAAIQQCAGVIFEELLRAHLADCDAGAAAEAQDDAAEEAVRPWEEEALERIAALARASLPTSLPALHQALTTASQALPQAVNSNLAAHAAAATAGAVTPGGVLVSADAALERLWMMLRVVACVAADDVHGEVAMVPADIEALCRSRHPAVADLRAIGEIIRQVAGLPTGPNKYLASPRLMEAALWALARWADTYDYLAADWNNLEGSEIAQPVESTPAAAQALAPQDVCAAASHTISACVACIMQFPAEVALHEVAVERVLRRVVCQGGRAALLQQVPAWREMQQEFAARPLPGAFSALNSRLQRPLAAAVCAHVAELRAAPRHSKLDMLQHLLASSCEAMVQVAAQCSSATGKSERTQQDAATVEQLAVALERVTGAVEGANVRDNCVVYDVLVPCMEPMLVVQRAFRHHELITRILFTLAAAMAREHTGELRREGGLLGAEELTQWAVALISNFAAHLAAEGGARAATDVAAKSTAGKEEEAERSAQFESAFELLQHLTSFLAEAPSLSDAILQAFQILLANLPRKLLSYPSVTVACIGAVRMLCEEAPEKFSKLPPESFGAHPNQPNQVQPPEYVSLIMSTLQWGINHSDMVVVRDAVRAVAEVVVEHKQEHSEGRVGLSLFLGPDGSPLVSFLMKQHLALLLRTKNPQEVMALVATVLEPLLVSDPPSFGALVTHALTHGASEELNREDLRADVTRKAEALQASTQEKASGGITAFTRALEEFVGATWGLLNVL